MANELTPFQRDNYDTLRDLLNTKDKSKELQRVLPTGVTIERFAGVALNTCMGNPALLECTADSIFDCIRQAASLVLEIQGVLGHAYMVPYRVKGVQTAQLQLGYRGLVYLAMRGRTVVHVGARVVYSKDGFDVQEGTSPHIIHRPLIEGDPGDPIAAYAVAVLRDGQRVFRVLPEREVVAHRQRSRAFTSGGQTPWKTDPDAMWEKTAIRVLCKSLPQAPIAQYAAIQDELVDVGIRDRWTVTEDHMTVKEREAQRLPALPAPVPMDPAERVTSDAEIEDIFGESDNGR